MSIKYSPLGMLLLESRYLDKRLLKEPRSVALRLGDHVLQLTYEVVQKDINYFTVDRVDLNTATLLEDLDETDIRYGLRNLSLVIDMNDLHFKDQERVIRYVEYHGIPSPTYPSSIDDKNKFDLIIDDIHSHSPHELRSTIESQVYGIHAIASHTRMTQGISRGNYLWIIKGNLEFIKSKRVEDQLPIDHLNTEMSQSMMKKELKSIQKEIRKND
ncbi:hypothetical protein LIS04_198 [Listeria phage LIS04]|nr:hypothetical protein LIS04_198 [Listeria phage LIS04]